MEIKKRNRGEQKRQVNSLIAERFLDVIPFLNNFVAQFGQKIGSLSSSVGGISESRHLTDELFCCPLSRFYVSRFTHHISTMRDALSELV